MLCCDVQRGPRKREVFAVPRTPKATEGHLPTVSGKETRTRRATRRRHQQGWWLMPRVWFANYGCSMSRSYATSTRTTDYATVPEEAAGFLNRAECHIRMDELCRDVCLLDQGHSVQSLHRVVATEGHGQIEFGQKIEQDFAYPLFAAQSQTPEVGATQ